MYFRSLLAAIFIFKHVEGLDPRAYRTGQLLERTKARDHNWVALLRRDDDDALSLRGDLSLLTSNPDIQHLRYVANSYVCRSEL
jgi:hypothetical protein